MGNHWRADRAIPRASATGMMFVVKTLANTSVIPIVISLSIFLLSAYCSSDSWIFVSVLFFSGHEKRADKFSDSKYASRNPKLRPCPATG